MNIGSAVPAVRRRWWLVLAAVAAGAGASWAVTAAAVPQYQTSMTFFVTTPNQTAAGYFQGSTYTEGRMKSYADLLLSDRLADRIAGAPEIGLSAAQVQSRLQAHLVPDTVMLVVTVTDSRPDRSTRIAHEVSQEFITLLQEVETPVGTNTPLVTAKVVGGPHLNPRPVSPQPVRNLEVGLGLGLLVGLGGAVLREHLDGTVKSAEQLGEVARAPVLAVVPFDARTSRSPVAAMKDPQSPRAEAYRHLRTNLRFVNVDNPTRVILVSSSLPAEGKSTTAVNLAVSLSEAGKRVLLIDADMRHPNLAEYLGLEGSVGLSDLLAGMVGTDDVLQRWGRHDLHVLTSGQVPPNPSELVGSANMAALLTEQRERFDFIVLDTPPLLPVTDAAALSPYVDGIVLVCRAAKTPGAGLARAVGNLRGVEARLLGCVLSMTREKRSGYGTYARDTRTPHRHSMGAVARVPLTAEVSLARQHGSAGRAERPVNAP